MNLALIFFRFPERPGPPAGEHCDACDRLITEPLVIEGIAALVAGRQSVQMHVECFAIWDEERKEPRP